MAPDDFRTRAGRSARSARRPSQRRGGQPLRLEALEDRDLMAGDLALGFDVNGTATFDFGLPNGGFAFDAVTDVAVQADGKIVAVGSVDPGGGRRGGNRDFAVLRLNPNGTLDTTFTGDGMEVYALDRVNNSIDEATSVAIDGMGRIVVGGSAQTADANDFAAIRLLADGTLDTSFGGAGDGIATLDLAVVFGGSEDVAADMIIDNAGRIVFGGTASRFLAIGRLTPDGLLDTSFGQDFANDGVADGLALFGVLPGQDSRFNDTVAAIAADSNDDYYLAGELRQVDDVGPSPPPGMLNDPTAPSLILKFDTDGGSTSLTQNPLDASFGNGGVQLVEFARTGFSRAGDLLIDEVNGDLYLGASVQRFDTGTDFAVARLDLATGVLDTTYGGQGGDNAGTVTFDFGMPDDGPFANPAGTDSFAQLEALALDAGGRIVAAGSAFNFEQAAVARLNVDGTLDPTFGAGGKTSFVYPTLAERDARLTNTARAVALTPEGDVVVGGSARTTGGIEFAVAKLNGSGVQASGFAGELAFFRDGEFFFDVDRDGAVDATYRFGAAGDEGLVGDWNGDGLLDLATFNAGVFSFDFNRNGEADQTFAFGGAGDRAFLVDFNGDGVLDPVVYNTTSGPESLWMIDLNRDGAADFTQAFGIPGDRPFIGDFDGNETLDLGVFRQGPTFMQFFFDTANDGGAAEDEIWFGVPGDEPFLGDIDGDGRLDPGVFRFNPAIDGGVNQYFFDTARDGGVAEAEVWLRGAAPGDDAVFVPPGRSIGTGFNIVASGLAGAGAGLAGASVGGVTVNAADAADAADAAGSAASTDTGLQRRGSSGAAPIDAILADLDLL